MSLGGESTFHAAFEAQVARSPHRPAVVCGEQVRTFSELNAAANRIAHHLRRRGVAPGACVALFLGRSVDMIVGLLGILKAGGAYVPLLPDAPKARLAHQLAETEAPVVLTHARLTSLLPASAPPAVCLDRDSALLAAEPADDPAPSAGPSDSAYVIYTSGSTGLPKGVAVRHENLLNYTRFIADKLRMADFDAAGGLSFATVSTLAADLGNTCIFPSLAFGGTLHVIDHETAVDGDAFAAYGRTHRIDVLKITPSHLGALLSAEHPEDVLPRRILVTGGEASTWPLVDRITQMAPDLRWINHYGPTETTIGSLTFDLTEAASVRGVAATVPIGRPIAATQVHILDEAGAPVPEGEPGELYIAGAGVSSGYLRQPEKTAERFVPDPFSPPGAKMYRTGDRVRRLAGGAIEFLGRVDFQVKIRGYRVELGEIEAVLRKHAGLREAIVLAKQAQPDDLRLVAYLVPNAGFSAADAEAALRRLAREHLPEHMVPSVFVPLDALPLTPNGKVDRKALPDPFVASAMSEPVPPAAAALEEDDLENQVADVWKKVLGLRKVPLDRSFFDVGGHSLAAIQVLAEVHKRTGKRLPNAVLFESPTIAGMAEALRDASASPEFRSLVPMQPKGRKPPLFCVHGGGGHVYWYKPLSSRLGEDQPFFGLQCRVEDDGRVHTKTVEDMATYYLAEIRAAFPRGPYYLSGASFGGKVAYEMALRLRNAGEQVALLAMFDTWGPGYPETRPDATAWDLRIEGVRQRLDHHLGALWMLESGRRMPYLREKLHYGYIEGLDRVDHLAMDVSRWTYKKRGRAVPKDMEPNPGFIRLASAAYDPPPYDGEVHLFRSKNQPPGAVFEPYLRWDRVVKGPLHVVELPGMHATMVLEPRVRFLVEAFRPVLEAAQNKFG